MEFALGESMHMAKALTNVGSRLPNLILQQQKKYRGPLLPYLASWALFSNGTLLTMHWSPEIPPTTPAGLQHDLTRPATRAAFMELVMQRLSRYNQRMGRASSNIVGDDTSEPFASSIRALEVLRAASFVSVSLPSDSTQLTEFSDEFEAPCEWHVMWSADMSEPDVESAARRRLAADMIESRVVHVYHPPQQPFVLAHIAAALGFKGDGVAQIVYDYADFA